MMLDVCSRSYEHQFPQGVDAVMDMGFCSVFMQLWTWVSTGCSRSYGHGSLTQLWTWVSAVCSHSYEHGSLQGIYAVMDMGFCSVFMQLWT